MPARFKFSDDEKIVFAFVLALASMVPYAQTATDTIDTRHVNFELVEKLFMEKLNAYRQSLSMGTLSPSEALKQAAIDQALYQQKINQLSHHQETERKYTVLDRIFYYRGRCRTAGENSLYTWIGVPVRDRNTHRIRTLVSYDQAAEALFEQWKNSPGHHRIMVTPCFEKTGLGFAYNPKEKKLYAVQVFAGNFP